MEGRILEHFFSLPEIMENTRHRFHENAQIFRRFLCSGQRRERLKWKITQMALVRSQKQVRKWTIWALLRAKYLLWFCSFFRHFLRVIPILFAVSLYKASCKIIKLIWLLTKNAFFKFRLTDWNLKGRYALFKVLGMVCTELRNNHKKIMK